MTQTNFKYSAALALSFALLAPAAMAQNSVPEPAASLPEQATSVITASRGREHVEQLASDRMMGRNTPSPELDSAAEYIAMHFKSFGLDPVAGTYFHHFNLKQEDLGAPNTLVVGAKSLALKDAFIPYEFSSNGVASGLAVFVGYGLSRPDSGYDDYAGIDVRGKIVVAVAGEPETNSGERLFGGSLLDASPREKMRTAIRHGASGFILMPHPKRSKFLRPTGYPWRALYPNPSKSAVPLKLDLPQSEPSIPSISIGGDAIKGLFGSVDSIAAVVDRIDSSGRPGSIELSDSIVMEVRIEKKLTPARNVIAMAPGRLKPEEYVVIGAHYDHVGHFHGIQTPGKSIPDTIYNGADDNASGTSGLLMAAEAFGRLTPEERPARSVIFIAFSGEEKGLYGSRAYVADPLVPNERIIAMLNMDMIGRNHRDSVSLGGRSRSKDLADIAEAANAVEPMRIAYNLEDLFYRSDQASFAVKGIPVLFFSSGLHADYHQVSDSPEKVDVDKLAQIARLCFRTAWLAADVARPPVFTPEEGDRDLLAPFE